MSAIKVPTIGTGGGNVLSHGWYILPIIDVGSSEVVSVTVLPTA
jgi:hypothetical protein